MSSLSVQTTDAELAGEYKVRIKASLGSSVEYSQVFTITVEVEI